MRSLPRPPQLPFALLLLLGGCVHSPQAPRTVEAPRTTAATDPEQALLAEVQALAGEVSALRQLALQAPLKVRLLHGADFSQHLARNLARKPGPSAEQTQAFLIAFGFIESSPFLGSNPEAVIREQVFAFYDEQEKTLIVQTSALDSTRGDPAGRRQLLVHEIEHALQDQHFDLTAVFSRPDDDLDVFRARQALFEGEAQLVAYLDAAQRGGKPVDAELNAQKQLARSVPAETLLQVTGPSPVLARVSVFFREGLLFPYRAGSGFAIDLYRAGGYPLLQQVFAHPPCSTAEILHPDRYLKGEVRVEVQPPAPLAGRRSLGAGALGELGTRVLLQGCQSLTQAEETAAGLRGDAFLVSADSRGALALQWSTLWKDAAAAEAGQAALEQVARCWEVRTEREEGGALTISDEVEVRREGVNVAFTRGLGPAGRRKVLQALLRLPRHAPAQVPPVGAVQLRPDESSHQHPGRMEGRLYVSDWLGVKAQVPPGVQATAADPTGELSFRQHSPAFFMGGFNFMAESYAPAQSETLFKVYAGILEADLPHGEKLRRLGHWTTQSAWGAGSESVWRYEGSEVRTRGTLIPACGGRATVMLFDAWERPEDLAALDAWRASFDVRAHAASPACASLEAAPRAAGSPR